MPKLHMRALEVINDSTAWVAGNRGIWAYTSNGGKTWQLDSIRMDTIYPQFRSIAALNDSTILLLNVGSPAHVLKTTNKGRTWKVAYTNTHKDIFFDALHFANLKHGLALGDPINGHFQLISTDNAGETWSALDTSSIPPALEGEACFAASNSNLCTRNNQTWFVTGGKHSRIFHQKGKGKFITNETPLPQGEQMTGIYSVDFFDDKKGVISGGHYDKSDTSLLTLAYTNDGGKSWKPFRSNRPSFGSCVRFLNENQVLVTGHNGTFLVNLKMNRIVELVDSQGSSLKFYTLRLSPSRNYLWLAGSQGKVARLSLKDILKVH